MKAAVSLLLFAYAVAGIAADQPKHSTKTSDKQFDLPKEVIAFVSHLIDTDPDVRTQYQKLIAPTQEKAGGRFKVGGFVAIEWLVPDFSVEFRDTGGTRDGEYVYLVQQQLVWGQRRGYAVEDNVLARVRVKLHEDHKRDRGKPDESRLSSNSIELTFEGFFGVTLNPK